MSQPDRQPYWRSLNELADTPEFRRFLDAEFPESADRGGFSRRRWLQLMGASLALGGAAAGCRWEQEDILPFAKRPADRTPGKAKYFATSMELGGVALGLMATSHDGRPTKLEGNPRHPASRGATHAQAQAAILTLYDPDRSRSIVEQADGQTINQPWDKFADSMRDRFIALRKKQGTGLRVLSSATSSPTLLAMRDRLLEEFPQARWVEWEPVSRDQEREGMRQAFGRPLRPHLKFDQARIIVALDEDFLGGHPNSVRYAADFVAHRDPDGEWMSRLYSAECRYTITGMAADHRLAIRAGDIRRFVSALEDRLTLQGDGAAEPGAAPLDKNLTKWLLAVTDDLLAHRGASIVVAGPGQPPEVHAAVMRINAALGNLGNTIVLTEEPDADRPPHAEALQGLATEMAAGEVDTLLILDANPVYDAPADVDFAGALDKVGASIHLGLYRDETGRRCTWHVPQAHFLETWGDARSWDGTYTTRQPMLRPLYGGRSPLEMLAQAMNVRNISPREKVREKYDRLFDVADDSLEKSWRRVLHAGLVDDSPFAPVDPPDVKPGRLASNDPSSETEDAAEGSRGSDWEGGSDSNLELVLYPDPKLLDGRFANNAWLQELPDPMLRSCWTNAAVMSPATAERLRVEDNEAVTLTLGETTLELPAYIMPGQADGSIAVALGYGRTAAGAVGGDVEADVSAVGVSVYPLRSSETPYIIRNVRVASKGYRWPVPCVQDHFAIDTVGRERTRRQAELLIREATLEHYREHPHFAEHVEHHMPPAPLWEEWEYPDHKWGMAIDLTRCIGCGACVVACQAENNIPVVGPERVLEGREMLWLRVDRYFKGDPSDPQAAVQPVACHHCETAPCEQVCPVNATVHSHEGLNDMVYNRCIGTRYCSNNCPFKVRRFNYFNYHADLKDPANEPAKMKYNPEVTVRSRGVMEKCTYCVQRIQAAKIRAKNERRPVADGEIRTACQQVCPTGAIVFGNLNDRDGQATGWHGSPRAYRLLQGLNIEARTAYLAKIGNPNPKLMKAHDGHS